MYQTGYYVDPVSMFLVHSATVDGDELFPASYRNLRKLYPGAYAPSTLGPGPDYPVALTGQAHERGDSQHGDQGGEGLGKLIIDNSFSDLGTADLGRISNIFPSVARMNNLIPNLTTAYFNTPPPPPPQPSLESPPPQILVEEIMMGPAW